MRSWGGRCDDDTLRGPLTQILRIPVILCFKDHAGRGKVKSRSALTRCSFSIYNTREARFGGLFWGS